LTHARLALLLISTISFFSSKAQINSIDVENAIEALFALPDTDLNYEELYERYLLLYESPIDLNSADYSDLKALHAFSDEEIQSILTYRDSVGNVMTLYELAFLDAIDPYKLQKLSSFLTIKNQRQQDLSKVLRSIFSQQHAYLISRVKRRIEQARGYQGSTPSFAGDQNKLYFRYRNVVSKRYSLGITAEKDAGEAFVYDPSSKRIGMDFWSAHLMLENQGKLKRSIIGDYQLQFGQGLVFNSGLGIGKGAETVNTIEKVYNGLRPYTSVLEGGFLRGAAATYEYSKKLSATAFFSSLSQDANLRERDDSSLVFSSFQRTGLHRTESEIARKQRVNEVLFGFNLNYRMKNLNQLGLTWQTSHYSANIDRGDDPTNLFEFSGNHHMNLSLYGNKQVKQFRFFGELAMSGNQSLGTLLGVAGKLDPRLQAVLLLRNYDKSFHSFRGGGFGESSRNSNESGIYLGLKYTLNRQFFLTAYYDRFHRQWLSFRVQRPSKGYDYLLRLNYRPNSTTQFYFQYRSKEKDRNIRLNKDLLVLPGISNRYILHLDFRATNTLSLRSKVQWSNYRINAVKTTGIAFFQDLNLRVNEFSCSARFSVFQTEGGDNRQFAYERDVLYGFSIPGLSGTGIRNYLLLQYRPLPKVSVWLKLSRTTYFDRDEIGTGVETIQGNTITDIKFQTMIKF